MSSRYARRRNQRNQRNQRNHRHQRRNNQRRLHDNRTPRPTTGDTNRSSPLPPRPAPEQAPVPETVVSDPSRPPSVADSAVSLFPNAQDDQTRGGNQSIRSNQVQQELAWNPTNPPLRPGTVVSDPTPSGITFHHPSFLQIRPPSSAHVNRMRGGTASNPDTPPTPFVDENGDVQGLSPFFQPQIQPPPQAQVQPNDDMSAITQNDRTAQFTSALNNIQQILQVLLERSDHLDERPSVHFDDRQSHQSDAESRPSHHGNKNTVPPAPLATASSADYHQPLDLPLKIVNYQGSEMTNSPVLLCPGDEAFWKYGNDLMRSVIVIETTLPTILRRQPIYHIKCSNDQEHDVRHDELFISKSDALALDHDGFIRSTGSVLSASDHLDLHAINGPHS